MRCLVVASQADTGRLIAHQPAKAGRRCRRARLRVRGLGTSAAGSVYPVCPANGSCWVVLGFAGNGFVAAPLGGCGLAGTCEPALCRGLVRAQSWPASPRAPSGSEDTKAAAGASMSAPNGLPDWRSTSARHPLMFCEGRRLGRRRWLGPETVAGTMTHTPLIPAEAGTQEH